MTQMDRLLQSMDEVLITVLELKCELLEFQQDQTVWDNLSPAEREIYPLMKQGKSRRQIAEELFKSEETIKKQIKSIRNKQKPVD